MRLCVTMYNFVLLCMTMYESFWLCMTLYGRIQSFVSLCYSGWLYMILFNASLHCITMVALATTNSNTNTNTNSFLLYLTIWLWLTMFDSDWFCFALFHSVAWFDSCLTWIVCVLLCLYFLFCLVCFAYFSILFNYISICLNILNFVWLCLTHAVMHIFCACFTLDLFGPKFFWMKHSFDKSFLYTSGHNIFYTPTFFSN